MPPILYTGLVLSCKPSSSAVDMEDKHPKLLFEPEGGVLVGEDGRILAVGNGALLRQAHPTATQASLPEPAILIPGLIDLHVHLPQLSVRGRQEKTLLRWLEHHIFPAESRYQNMDYAQAHSRDFFHHLLAHGTTAAGVFTAPYADSVKIAFQGAQESGIRAVMGLNLMDQNAPEELLGKTDALLEATEALCQRWHGQNQGKLAYAWMPRFAITASEKLLKGLGELYQRYPGTYCHTHLSEQPEEIDAVLQLFPKARDYVDVYDQVGLLGPKTLLAHGIHLGAGELKRLGETQSSLIHCPSSNFFLKSGRFPWENIWPRAQGEGLGLGLGSDVGAGPALSMFHVMRDAQYIQNEYWIPLAQLFYAATLGGAHALGMEADLGSLSPGKQADFVVLTPPPNIPPLEDQWKADPETLLSTLVYVVDDRWVYQTVVGGNTVYRAKK